MKLYQNWTPSRSFFNDFLYIYGSHMYHFWGLTTPTSISQNSSEWLLKVYICLRLMPRQQTQVCTSIQKDLLNCLNVIFPGFLGHLLIFHDFPCAGYPTLSLIVKYWKLISLKVKKVNSKLPLIIFQLGLLFTYLPVAIFSRKAILAG